MVDHSQNKMARHWMKFFLDAGIPKESSAEYALTFESNRMEMDMLSELDKDYLRDLNITALGDIISILRHKKKVLSKSGAAEILIKSEPKSSSPRRRDSRSSSSSSSSSNEETKPDNNVRKKVSLSSSSTLDTKEKKPENMIRKKVSLNGSSPSTSSVVSRLGPVVSSEAGGVFSRLGSQQLEPEARSGKSPTKNIYERLGPEAEKTKLKPVSSSEPQEQRISSTSENIIREPGSQSKGILKKRGVGDGSALSRSKSAPNIISLKPQASSSKLKKRISFGKDEIRLMDPSPGIKSRLGFGRCSSPPPPEIDDIDEPSLQTELKKIAVGKGQFEIRKVMKVVNEKLSKLRDSVTPERKTEAKETNSVSGNIKNEKKPIMRITMKNEVQKKDESDYKVDKVDLALRAAKLKSNLDQFRENQTVDRGSRSQGDGSQSRKRLVKYETLADGSRIKTFIDYDDPILEHVPIKKMKIEPEVVKTERKKIVISGDHLADNFTVTRPSPRLSDSGSGERKTLAERAERAQGRPEAGRSIRDRIGPREVKGSADKNIFSRLGSQL